MLKNAIMIVPYAETRGRRHSVPPSADPSSKIILTAVHCAVIHDSPVRHPERGERGEERESESSAGNRQFAMMVQLDCGMDLTGIAAVVTNVTRRRGEQERHPD